VIRRVVVGAIALLALGLVPATPARAQSIGAMTSELQALQAKMAAGDQAAFAAQPERLKAISAAIQAAPPETWQTKSETDGAIVYLLSGGRARDIVQLLRSGVVPQSEAPLMRGALDYIVGDEVEAHTLLDDVDPRTLDLRLAAQIAFAQSVLASSKDVKKAIALLDLARLLAPGALIEEVALRREIALVADQRDVDRFTVLCRQYATRFGRSIYAEHFVQSLAPIALKADLIDDLASFQKFHAFVTSLTPSARTHFLLTVAHAEAVNGKFGVASVASNEALQDVASDSAEAARGKLYEASARILTPDYDSGVAELRSVAEEKLDKQDQALLGAVRGVAAYMREMPSEAASANPPPPTAKQDNDAVASTIALAEVALKRNADKDGASPKGSP